MKVHSNTLRRLRVAIAAIFFMAITLLFLDFTGSIHAYLGWMARLQFLPAILSANILVIAAILILTLVIGRIYCSVICPLGIFQDGISHISGLRKKKKLRFQYKSAHNIARYLILLFFIAAVVVGLGSVFSLLAPYSAYGRIVQNLFSPIYLSINNFLAYISERSDSYTFYSKDVWIKSLPTFIIALLTFIIITFLSWKNGRAYCNTICPVGTFLSFFAGKAWFKIHIDQDKCVNCGVCSKKCKASCIDIKNHKIDYTRCVVCADCIDNCAKKAISFSHIRKSKSSATTDMSRRAFLIGSTLLVGSIAKAQQKKKIDGGLAIIEKKKVPVRYTPISAPGSLSLKSMYSHCTSCGLCISVCPNDVLRPSSSLNHLMQPTLSYERGFCRPECTKCSEVCPSGAIKPIGRDVKSSTQIGHAVWIKDNCLPVRDGIHCGSCARHCPSGAIKMVKLNPDESSSPRVPAVNTEICIGCGACEYLCPARPFSAIYVEGNEVHRII